MSVILAIRSDRPWPRASVKGLGTAILKRDDWSGIASHIPAPQDDVIKCIQADEVYVIETDEKESGTKVIDLVSKPGSVQIRTDNQLVIQRVIEAIRQRNPGAEFPEYTPYKDDITDADFEEVFEAALPKTQKEKSNKYTFDTSNFNSNSLYEVKLKDLDNITDIDFRSPDKNKEKDTDKSQKHANIGQVTPQDLEAIRRLKERQGRTKGREDKPQRHGGQTPDELQESALEQQENITPVFQGALTRELGAKVLWQVFEDSDLSQRKFAEKLGIAPKDLREGLNGDRSIEWALKQAEKVGYRVSVTANIEPPEQ